MKSSKKITRSEEEVLTTLWNAGVPLSSSQIVNAAENCSWKPSYTHLLLNSLLKKELIRVAGFQQSAGAAGSFCHGAGTRHADSAHQEPAGAFAHVLSGRGRVGGLSHGFCHDPARRADLPAPQDPQGSADRSGCGHGGCHYRGRPEQSLADDSVLRGGIWDAGGADRFHGAGADTRH